jgi:hypothetical protein
MTDITALKQKLQQLEPLMKDRATAEGQYEAYADKLAPIEDKLNKIRGIARLKKPFIRAAKVRPLKRKQRKVVKRLAKKDLQIEKTIGDIYANLGQELTSDPKVSAGFSYLQNTFNAVGNTKQVVQRTAKKCKRAGALENIVGCTEENTFKSGSFSPNIPGIIWNAATGTVAYFNSKSAGKSITKAKQSLQSLQKQVQDAPQLKTIGAASIDGKNRWALMSDVILGGGGFLSWGSWGNWSLARNFKKTKKQLLDVSDKLDLTADRIISDQISLLATIGTQARETSPYMSQLLSPLEKYAPAKPQQNEPKPQSP